jgi:hypothetical protein
MKFSFLCLDTDGLNCGLSAGTIFQKFNDKRDAVNLGEYGAISCPLLLNFRSML